MEPSGALTEGQPAQLDLGDDAVACVVVGFTGDEIVLSPAGATPDATTGTAYLLIESGGTLHALKATVRDGATDGELVATLLDPFRLGQRRLFSRAPLVLPAHLRPRGDADPPVTTFTRDVSAGGVRVERHPDHRSAAVQELVIGLVQADREIRATAETVRETAADVSLRFLEIPAADRLLLARLTFAYHRRGAVHQGI